MRWLFRNFWWRVLSVGIAILIWMNVATEPEIATLISVPVQYREPVGQLEVSSRLVQTVQLETRGPSGRLRELTNLRTAVILDFRGVQEPGERTFTIGRAQTNLPRGVELLRATPSQLRFRFERRTTRVVPVRLNLSGALAASLQIDRWQLTPDQVEITGPASKVARVSAANTDAIDLGTVNREHNTFKDALYLSEPEVRFAGPSQVTVKIVLK